MALELCIYVMPMASLQAYQSHGRRYYRIVESFRENGRPRIRVIAHLGRVEDILRLHQQERTALTVSSVTVGAVTALGHLASELDVAGRIDRALQRAGRRLQKRDGLSVGETLVAGMIGRACAPGSKRAFAAWAESTWLPELMGFSATQLTSQHFWDQMHAVPIELLSEIEQELVCEVIRIEQLQVEALAYDTTNFYTHIATTNTRAQLPQRGHNKQGRHDLRQLGLALVVDQVTQLPLAHALYEGGRSDMRSFAEFLKPVRERLRQLSAQPQQLTLIFDAGASSKQNLDGLDPQQERYVTALRPSNHRVLLGEAVDHLEEVTLATGAVVKAWRTRQLLAGKEREAVIVFSPQLYEGQLRGLHQGLDRCWRELQQMGRQTSVPAAQQRLARICGRQYVRSVMRYEVELAEPGHTAVRLWCDWEEYRRLTTRYFGLRLLVTDRSEWSTAQIISAYRGLFNVEAVFRNLKDPGMLATHPQFHWTDQKLQVHIFMCVTAYLLVRLLSWRARKANAFSGSLRNLLSELSRIRLSRLLDHTGRAGRPRVRRQLEEMSDGLRNLGQLLRAFPSLD
jgi:transposase